MAAPGTLTPALLLLVLLPLPVAAQHDGHHNMQLDADGMVMNSNDSELPRGCSAIARDYEFAISASHDYASSAPGMIFGLSQHELRVEPCSRLHVTFTNQDEVRHQWMVHGLPKYLYPTGMFHLEANAGATVQGSLIVPAEDRTYLVHCDMAQHMEKGMKGQLVVGAGSGNLWSVKGVGSPFYRDTYLPPLSGWLLGVMFLGGLAAGLMLSRRRRKRSGV